jgi:hypothetical protein
VLSHGPLRSRDRSASCASSSPASTRPTARPTWRAWLHHPLRQTWRARHGGPDRDVAAWSTLDVLDALCEGKLVQRCRALGLGLVR